MSIPVRFFLLLSTVVSLLGTPYVYGQEYTRANSLRDQTIKVLEVVCDPVAPTELREFKLRQMERRILYLGLTIQAMKSDAAAHIEIYTREDKEDLTETIAKLERELNEAQMYKTSGCDRVVSIKGIKPKGSENIRAGVAAPTQENLVLLRVSDTVTDQKSPTVTNQGNERQLVTQPLAQTQAPAPAPAPAGVVAALNVSPLSLPFNPQVIKTKSAAQVLTLSNNDAVAHSLNAISIAGPDASDYGIEANACAKSLAATAKCTISVTFTPKDEKAHTASIDISDTTSGKQSSVNLTGSGAPPPSDPLSIYTPLFYKQKVISGIADKGSQYVSINVYKGLGCNLATFPKNCKMNAVGLADVNKLSGEFAARLFVADQKGLSSATPAELQDGDIVIGTETFTDTGVILPKQPAPIFVKHNSYTESNVPWGNVTPTFETGFVLSQNNGQFSQFNLFIGLNVDTSYHIRKKYRANAYVNTQLTSIPAASCQTSSSGSSGTSSNGQTGIGANCLTTANLTSSFNSFISSQKAAVIQGGLYFPVSFSSWKWWYGGHANSLFFAPVVKGGFQTVTTNSQSVTTPSPGNSTTTSTLNPSAFYRDLSGGLRLGHFQEWNSWNVAPELLSYIDFTFGKWGSFAQCPPTGCITDSTGTVTNLNRPYLFGVEGRLKVPSTPLILGFNTITPITGTGKSDFRFTIGIKLDLGCVYSALTTGLSLNSSGSCQKVDATTTNVGTTPSAVSITTKALGDGQTGKVYSETLAVTGGVQPYTWSIDGGLPDGLKLHPSTGQITGTPTTSGSNTFKVIVTDSSKSKLTGSESLTIKVAP